MDECPRLVLAPPVVSNCGRVEMYYLFRLVATRISALHCVSACFAEVCLRQFFITLLTELLD